MPSALIFCASKKSLPIKILIPSGRAKLVIFCAKISRSFLPKSYSRIMIAEFFGKFLITASKSEIFFLSVNKTAVGRLLALRALLLNFFISNIIF